MKDIRCPYCDSKKVAEWDNKSKSKRVRRFICMTCHQQWHTIAKPQETALEQKESKTVHNKIEFPEYNDGLLEEFDKQFFENGQDDDLTETALEQKDK